MKNLVELLNESLIAESEQMLRFEFGDLEHADETIKSIEDISNKNDIYSEKISDGIKIKVNDSNRDKLYSIQDILQQYVQKMQDNDKVDENKVKKLADQLNKLNDFIDNEDDEDDENEDEDKDKNKSDGE